MAEVGKIANWQHLDDVSLPLDSHNTTLSRPISQVEHKHVITVMDLTLWQLAQKSNKQVIQGHMTAYL